VVLFPYNRWCLLTGIYTNAYLNEKGNIKSHNFSETLPENMGSYASEILKSIYNLGFLGVTQSIKERELEQRLVEKIKHFILELGKGFSRFDVSIYRQSIPLRI
jgi:predicted nuclease of restriction endonuclease-like (RecB) superfamily